MLEGGNKNLAAYKENLTMQGRQTFHYEPTTKHFLAEYTGNIIGFDWDHWLANDSVFTLDPNSLKDGQKGVQWDIYYCKGW